MTGLLTEYLGAGLLADRPAIPAIVPGALAFYAAEDTGDVYRYDSTAAMWIIVGGGGGGGGGGGIEEAPNDGNLYVRTYGDWVRLRLYPANYRVINTAPTVGGFFSVAEISFLADGDPIGTTLAFSSGDFGGYPASNAIDGNTSSNWISNSSGGTGLYIGYTAASVVGNVANSVSMTASSLGGEANRVATSFDVQVSDDNRASWTTLWSVVAAPAFNAGETRVFTQP